MHLPFRRAALVAALASACAASTLPVVDLGYELHRAISLDETSGIYNFSNIRYAAPPLGDLRFSAPVPPEWDRSKVQDGSVGRICPQATPLWLTEIEPDFVESQLSGRTFNGSANISDYTYDPPPQDPRTTEDCLFLDVLVPKKIFDKGHDRLREKAPVLVWIYGGGYTAGEKSAFNASGLMQRSMQDGRDGIVYVSLNYRLGAFGWLGGETFKKNGTANAGLLDQRLALEWVQKHIHLFGGDPDNVTVMGESAGGGSIFHQITAYGGQAGPAPFKQAILQSPGWIPVDEDQQETTLQQFLGLLNVNTIEEARKLPSDELISANAYQVAVKSGYGFFTYGPVVDGDFAPDLPGRLLLKGDFDHNVKVMVGHNADEGLLFTSPTALNESGYSSYLKSAFPGLRPNVSEYIIDVLYPPIYNGSYGYTNSVERVSLTIADVVFQCNADYLNRAFRNQTYGYLFSVPPALHGQDVAYTFFSGKNASGVANVTVALAMQEYITSFVETGVPKSSLGPVFEKHGTRNRLLELGDSEISVISDPTANARCRWWQTGKYYND